MFRFALRFLGQTQDAEDVIQDVWMKFLQRHPSDALIQIEAWCMQAVKNRCLDLLRHREVRQKAAKLLQGSAQQADGQPADHRITFQEARWQLDRALAQLPLKQRMVVQLRDLEEYAYQDIADILGISLEDVKVSLFRARKTLRMQLTQSRVYELR